MSTSIIDALASHRFMIWRGTHCFVRDPTRLFTMTTASPNSGSAHSARREISTAVNAFRRILRALRLASTETQAATGISAAQLFVLWALSDQRTASLSELAQQTLTDRSSVAAVVDRLAHAGLVSRTTDPTDRRRASISITRAGSTVLSAAPRAPTSMLMEALEALPADQLLTLSTGLSALTDAMGLSDQPAAMLFEDDVPKRRTSSSIAKRK